MFVLSALAGCLLLPGLSGAEISVALKFTDRPDTVQVQELSDMKGKTYLPLAELARFYGVQLSFDPLARRAALSKGKNKVKLVLSQPIFLALDPDESFPIDPVEMVSGQLGVPAESAEDILRVLLETNIQYFPDQQSLVAGDVTAEDLKKEILAAAQQPAPRTAAPTKTPAAPASISQAPTYTPEPVKTTVMAQTVPRVKLPPPGRAEERAASPNKIYQVRRIVIDAGHGGHDSGAKSNDCRFKEKEATLDIAKRVASVLRTNPGLEVLLTRTEDRYVSLNERTEFANRHKADLFVSIHCNSNPRSGASGREIYVYSAKASNQSAAVAAFRENGRRDDLPFIFDDLRHNAFKGISEELARRVERMMRNQFKGHDRKIQKAPFYVLARVDMPSILIETAFLSNREEEKKLKSEEWRQEVASAIADGILDFRSKVEETIENQEARQ